MDIMNQTIKRAAGFKIKIRIKKPHSSRLHQRSAPGDGGPPARASPHWARAAPKAPLANFRLGTTFIWKIS